MSRKKKFSIIYWIIIFFIAIVLVVNSGTSRKEGYVQTTGTVIDLIPNGTRGYRTNNAQIKYVVDGKEYFFVDKDFNPLMPKHPQVLYRPEAPEDAKAYTIFFWLAPRMLIPLFLIAICIHSLIIIQMTDYGDKKDVLVSETDNMGL